MTNVPAGRATMPPPRCPAMSMAFCMAAKSSPEPFGLSPVTVIRAVALEPVAAHLKTEYEPALRLGLGLPVLVPGLGWLKPRPPVLGVGPVLIVGVPGLTPAPLPPALTLAVLASPPLPPALTLAVLA